jgi:hypothetical protein
MFWERNSFRSSEVLPEADIHRKGRKRPVRRQARCFTRFSLRFGALSLLDALNRFLNERWRATWNRSGSSFADGGPEFRLWSSKVKKRYVGRSNFEGVPTLMTVVRNDVTVLNLETD